ncbi:Fic family protein [Zhongshania sp.]|uniref:Fic family protein n=1 Tax=Zhongshania sp. TaxID=1971902 RepID=UPI003569CE5E
MTRYIHELSGWPSFSFDEAIIAERLPAVSRKQGRLLGRMESLGFDLRQEAELYTLTEDVLRTSEIEGEILDKQQVRSSIARHLGMDIPGLVKADHAVEGVVEMMLDATRYFDKPLTRERLCSWHAALFPTGRSGMHKITVGDWRKAEAGPMQVVSGPIGRETIHFEAPDPKRLPQEMARFLEWFEAPFKGDLNLKAGIAHLWFVTIHPFEDGNGRTARALADMQLARAEGSPHRFYSMSAEIQRQHKSYYDILEKTQKGSLDITSWLVWFLEALQGAIDGAEIITGKVMAKAKFWSCNADQNFNARQQKMLNRLLDGFEGKLTSSKWAKICKCSQDTATRDINDLMARGLLEKEPAGGRSTSYVLVSL